MRAEGGVKMFLNVLERLMAERGLNKSTLSKLSGIPYTTIDGFFKKGYENTKLSTLRQLSNFFGVTLDYLVYGELPERPQILTIYEQLNDIGKQKAIDGISDLAKIPEYTTKKTTADERKRRIERMPYYDVPASAGTGQYLDYSTMRMVSVGGNIPENADYILKVSGDSMEPQFKDGEFVFVNKSPVLNTGDIGIFYYENNVYIKKYGADGLVSLNPAYPLIPMDEDISCLGKVIGKVNGEIYF